VKFYDPYGKYLRNIRIPGESISGITWEGSGLRIALAVDSNIFFANIRPAYTWAYLLNSVVLSHGGGGSNKNGSIVVFWDLTSNETHSKSVGNLKFLAARGDVCAVVVLEKGDSRIEKKIVSIVFRICLNTCIIVSNVFIFYMFLFLRLLVLSLEPCLINIFILVDFGGWER
jgi:WD repeat-containing protein 35